ncbi:MAG: hypothetical protein JNJ58_02375 [Chitinophagaceae bacterium]|nr:hypothetical protein [Chitinophagaceae bacterium]
MKKVQIVGGGGLAKDVIACFKDTVHFTGIWDDQLPKGSLFNQIPVLGTLADLLASESDPIILAFGNPKLREVKFNELSNAGVNWATLIHPMAKLFSPEDIEVGQGCILMPYAYITTHVSVGLNCLLHIASGIHHDARLGNHSVMMPGSRITCGAILGKCSRLLTHASIREIDHFVDFQDFMP